MNWIRNPAIDVWQHRIVKSAKLEEAHAVRQPAEISIELTAQDLLTPPAPQGLVEIEDICALDSVDAQAVAANMATGASDDDSIEIELTPEEMDALLAADFSLKR